MTASMLANHVWQSTIVAGLAWLITIALRRNRAGARYGVWLAASLKFLVPFAVLVSAGSSLGWRAVPVATQPQVAIVMDAIGQPFSASPARMDAVAPVASAFEIPRPVVSASLVVVWLAGGAAVALTWFVRWRRVSAVVRESVPMGDGPVVDALRRLERDAGIAAPVVLLSSDRSLEPGVFGILRPVLLWPRRISEHLSDAQIDAILAHELSHVRRRDNLTAGTQMVVQAIFWFHPLVWWIGARLVDERERACDEAVVQLGSEPQTYAEGILKTCQFYVESPLLCVAGVTGSDLKRRIEHIMSHDAGAALNVWKKTLLATTATVAIVGPMAVGVLSAPPLRAQSQADEAAAVIRLRVAHAALLRQEQELEQRLGVLAQETAALAAKSPAFDVTSVKPNNSGAFTGSLQPLPGGRLNLVNVPLKMMIRVAYRLGDFQIVGGPDWLATARFDLLAKAAGDPTQDQLLVMLRTAMADRFKLMVHNETRELPIYALTVARADGRLGPQMRQMEVDCIQQQGSSPPPAPSGSLVQAGRTRICGFKVLPGAMTAGSVNMVAFATTLSGFVGRVVVDRTGLTGGFDLDLTWTPDNLPLGPRPSDAPQLPAIDPNGPALFTALQEQLGLKLESTKGPVEVLVIDRAEKPSAD